MCCNVLKERLCSIHAFLFSIFTLPVSSLRAKSAITNLKSPLSIAWLLFHSRFFIFATLVHAGVPGVLCPPLFSNYLTSPLIVFSQRHKNAFSGLYRRSWAARVGSLLLPNLFLTLGIAWLPNSVLLSMVIDLGAASVRQPLPNCNLGCHSQYPVDTATAKDSW